MKNISTQPADLRLARLYQERKACHPMPKQLQDEILSQFETTQSQPYWRKTPVWGTTLAACFVLVLSFQFLPQQQSQNADEAIVLQDIAKTEQESLAADLPPKEHATADVQGQQARKKQQSIPAAPSPSLATTGAIVVQAKLLPVSEGQTQRIAIDCLGKPISLGEHNLARLSDDQWLDIHFHHDGTIMRITKNLDFKGCPGD